MATDAAYVDPSALEKGVAHDDTQEQQPHGKKKHHHHPHLHLHTRRKREAEKIKSKLPGVMHVDDHNVDRLRNRLIIKNEIIAAIAELCGTFLFLLFSFGIATQAGQQQLSQSSSTQIQNGGSSTSNTDQTLYSSLGFGFSLSINAWIFFRVSGGLFNPAVTLGLAIVQAITWYRAIILAIVQFAAAIAAAGVAQLITPGGINARTRLGGGTSIAQGWFIEMFSTALLMLSIFFLAGEKHKGTFLAPVGIGLTLFIAELYATGLTGGSLNPARSLGPDVIAAEFDGTAWIYYTAPFVGTLLSSAIYLLLKLSHYETANEGQDGDDTALLLRDADGNLTGAVQQVAAADVPEITALKQGTDGIAGKDDRADAASVAATTMLGHEHDKGASASPSPVAAPAAAP